MPAKKAKVSTAAPPVELDLKARHATGPPDHDMNRFHIFLIDTGWNTAVSKVVRSHLPLVYEYQKQDSLYLLTAEQSVEILKRAPEFIGHDPMVVVYDRYAPADRKHSSYRGFRLCLGRIKHPGQALSRLQEFLRFLISHRTAVSLEIEVRRELNREGARGLIQIFREASTEFI
jgi:hypothetical protein